MLVKKLGETLRVIGQRLDSVGASLEGPALSYSEHLNLSTRLVAHKTSQPTLSPHSAFVANNASLIGNVDLADGASVWYGAVVSGDVNGIMIGKNTNIQDRANVRATLNLPTTIGDNVTIGPNAILEGCTVADQCIIGTGAKVLNGAVIGANSMVTAGSVVTEKEEIPSGQLWNGAPAKFLRDLTSEEIEFMKNSSTEYVELAKLHAVENNKTFTEVEEEKEYHKIMESIGEEGLPQKKKEGLDHGLFFRY